MARSSRELSRPKSGGKLFVFDVGGVLIRLDHAARRSGLGLGQSSADMAFPRKTRLQAVNLAYRLGQISDTEYLEEVSDVLGLSAAQITDAELSFLKPGEESMRALVLRLRDKHRVIAFSNTQAIHWRFVRDRLLGPDLFDACYLSHEMGLEKPHPESYAAVAQAEGSASGDIVFIDDTAENIAAARRHGWAHCIHHVSPDETIARVDEILRA